MDQANVLKRKPEEQQKDAESAKRPVLKRTKSGAGADTAAAVDTTSGSGLLNMMQVVPAAATPEAGENSTSAARQPASCKSGKN